MEQKRTFLSPKLLRMFAVLLVMLGLLLGEAAVASYVAQKRATAGVTGREMELSLRLEELVSAGAAKAIEKAPLLEKHYSLPVHSTKGPVPDADGFHTTDDPMEVQAVIDASADLLDGQTMSWNPDIKLKPNSKIRYYKDESMLVIVWQEVRNFSCLTFAEVKLADATQMVRRVAQDKLGSHDWQTPTQMAKDANAVVAISADFFMFRGIGLSVYQGEIYRNEPTYLDHCFIDYDGNMTMTRRNELKKEDSQKFIEEHNVNFSLAFGPVLVEDGKKQPVPIYGLGEINDEYSRASFGQVDDLHYILMTMNSEPYCYRTGVIRDSIEIMYDKGCQSAYAIDGGRTASLVFNGKLVNNVNYGGERTMSDIIAFVSAVPEYEQ